MVAAREVITANQVRIELLQILGRHDMAGQDLATQARRITFKQIQDALCICILKLRPIASGNLARSVAFDLGWQHTHLNPQGMFPLRGAGRIQCCTLSNHKNWLGRQ